MSITDCERTTTVNEHARNNHLAGRGSNDRLLDALCSVTIVVMEIHYTTLFFWDKVDADALLDNDDWLETTGIDSCCGPTKGYLMCVVKPYLIMLKQRCTAQTASLYTVPQLSISD